MAGAQALSHRTGVPLPAAAAMAPVATAAKPAQAISSSFAGVLGRHDLWSTLVLGCICAPACCWCTCFGDQPAQDKAAKSGANIRNAGLAPAGRTKP